MAWYRAGGGGIPSSLKTGMNDVLNKKFGTSTTYAPNTWPDEVNLMGPLPEKTVSGAIASFSDGADDVPIKSLVCNVDANLSGVSSVGVVHGGKNLVSNSASAWESGTINSSGNNASGSGTRTIGYYEIQENAQFIISGINAPSTSSDFRIFYYDKNKNFLTYKNYSVTYLTTPENARYFRLRNVSVDDISTLQIEYGDTATAYEPYITPTTHTANLGLTIYVGSVDVVNGTGTDDTRKVDLSTLSWTYSSTRHYFYTDDLKAVILSPTTTSETPDLLAENYTAVSFNNIYDGLTDYSIAINPASNKGRLFVRTDGTNTITPTGYLLYKLETPETFTFTPVPINSRLGDNTLWADNGDTEVTYRADIDLLLGG